MDHLHASAGTNISMNANTFIAGRDNIFNIGTYAGSQDASSDTRKLAEWLLSLSSLNSHQIQKDVSEKVMNGTGAWVFEHPRFIDWITKKKTILWGTGIPGAGKTCLTSIVINHLAKDRKAIPVYVYCQYKAQSSTAQVLACLLWQIVLSSDSKVTTYVSDSLHKPCLHTNTTPTKSELLCTLHEALQSVNDIYLVIDALDELEDNVRLELVSDLISLQQPLFMTSRPLSDLPDINRPDFTIRAQDEDVRDFILAKIVAIPRLRQYLQEPEVWEETITKIQAKCQGMFLLAALQIGVLASGEIIDRRSLGKAIEKLPTSLNDQYKVAWERIQRQGPEARALACRAIVLVTHATRILTVDELLEALTVDIDTASMDGKRRTTTETLVSVSFGLLMVEKESNAVRPIHYTAQDFFESLKDPAFDNPHALFADVSAIYMSQAQIDYRLIMGQYSLRFHGHERAYPFISYAWSNLGHHAYQSLRYCESHIPSRFSQLTRNRQIIPMSLDPLLSNKKDYVQAIHFAAFHGLVSLFEDNQQEVHAKSSLDCSPLFYACLGGQSNLVERIMRLLGPTLDFGLQNEFGATILHAASQNGEISLLAQLLPRWYQISPVPGVRCQWVLGCLPILLNARMSNGQTALHLASHHGRVQAIKALLRCNDMLTVAGRNVVLLDGSLNMMRWDATAIHWFLGSSMIDVNAPADSGEFPLYLAVQNGHDAVVQLLLESPNIDVNAKGGRDGSSPLLIAVKNRREAVVRLLLDSPNMDVNAMGKDGRRPLHSAVESGHEAVIRLLLDSPSIDVNAKEADGRSPLHLAAGNGRETVVRLLLNSVNIDVNTGDAPGRSPLHLAAMHGHEPIVRLLLNSANIDVNIPDDDGWSPLHYAAYNGHEMVV